MAGLLLQHLPGPCVGSVHDHSRLLLCILLPPTVNILCVFLAFSPSKLELFICLSVYLCVCEFWGITLGCPSDPQAWEAGPSTR